MLDVREFYQATNPGKALAIDKPEDKKYYIDFSSVRGGEIVLELKENITFFSDDKPSCALFTGHIGCGKSTELLRLKTELEEEGYHTVYFESSEDLEMTDVDIIDILLAIARRISQSLENLQLEEPQRLKGLLKGVANILTAEVQGLKVKIPNVGEVGFENKGQTFTLAAGIGEITAKAKNDSVLRQKLNQYLGPQKTDLLKAINDELLEPAIAKLKQQGKKGLVAIIDNLDRLDNRTKPFGRPQQEYLFVDQGEYLSKLRCHVVYTMPLALKFSNDYNNLTQRFSDEPKVLPMVPVQLKDGRPCEAGIALLRQMVLARAFPHLEESQRLEKIGEVFDRPETLDRLCHASGGHVRDLLRLLNTWIKKDRQLPLSQATLDAVIRDRRHELALTITESEWELLRQVHQQKRVSGHDDYQTLVRSRLVFEYRVNGDYWFEVNPILVEAKELEP